MADAERDLSRQQFKQRVDLDPDFIRQVVTVQVLFPEVSGKEDPFHAVDDFDHDFSRGQADDIEVVKSFGVVAALDKI